MSSIRSLPDRLITQIAAGEVVERPASVVKELVENALDARASEIQVELGAGGRDYLRVRDDGTGMDAEDAVLAFRRHATSKLGRLEDLQSIATLGFRGEALAAIAAVSQVDLRTADQAGSGFHVRIEGGQQTVAEPTPYPVGTGVEVSSLFYNVPARRKFLKQAATEQRRCVEVVGAYALYHREIGFRLESQAGQIIEAPKLGDLDSYAGLRARVDQLFGRGLADHLVPFGDAPEAEQGIWGMVGDKETVRGRKTFVFVNGRLLRDRSLLSVFYRAVRDEWGGGEFPSLFLFLELAPDQVDVNVHPQKHEVRFLDSALNSKLYRRLRHGLGLARGYEDAPIDFVSELPPSAGSWQGLGGRPLPSETWQLPDAQSLVATNETPGPDGPHSTSGPTATVVEGRISEPSLSPTPSERGVPLSGRGGSERPFRILGQYKAALILVEGPDALYVIDQHVAHERVLFERILKASTGASIEQQKLVTPMIIDMSNDQVERIADCRGFLEQVGFEAEVLSGGSVALAAVPAMLSHRQASEFLTKVAAAGLPPAELASTFEEVLAASLSCRRAIKMHDVLNQEEVEVLLSELFAANNPYSCPHGRPVMLRLSDLELEKRFHRR